LITERLTRRSTLLTRPCGRRSGKKRVGSCEMALPDKAEARVPLARAGERSLRGILGAGEELLMHMAFPRFAQRLEGGRVAPALRQAVAAVAERVRGGAAVLAGAPATGTTSSRREFSQSARPANAATQLGG
jgi:hypothetical protein